MPLVSIGGKGPPGPTDTGGWACSKCHKILSRKDALRNHYLRKHKWNMETGEPATQEMMEAHKSGSKTGTHHSRASASPEHTEKTSRSRSAHSAEEKDVFGSVSDVSTSNEEDGGGSAIEVSDSPRPHGAPAILQPKDVEPSDAAVATSATGVSKEKAGTATTVEKVNWSTTPISVTETAHPCIRKRLELSKPAAPIRAHLQERGMMPPVSE